MKLADYPKLPSRNPRSASDSMSIFRASHVNGPVGANAIPPLPAGFDWPPEVDLILSSLEAGRAQNKPDRRAAVRAPYRTLAVLRLFSDLEDTDPWQLYTRDVDARGFGFITRHRLPLGYGGTVRLILPASSIPNNTDLTTAPTPNDTDPRELRAHCTLLRCREATPGWYEGALAFNRTQEIW